MQSGKILISAVLGTTAMTFFSYLVSIIKNRNFREPEILSQLIERLPKNGSKAFAKAAGWGLHYSIGTLFVVAYERLWKQKKITPSVSSGVVIGAASGLIGVTGWKGMLHYHPSPPQKNLKRFFGHLMLAHIVFGVFCSLGYKITETGQRH